MGTKDTNKPSEIEREQFEQQLRVFWEGLNRKGKRDFLKRARKGVYNTGLHRRVV